MRAAAFGCALLFLWALPRASAQETPPPPACAEGRVRGPEGRCCWPGQTFSADTGLCTGAPECPITLVAHGDMCVAPVLEALPDPGTGTDTTYAPPGYAGPEAGTSSIEGRTDWPSILYFGDPDAMRQATLVHGEDEPHIAGSFALFDLGWLFGWLVPLMDELNGACAVTWGGPRVSCGSWPIAFVPVVGGLISGLTSFGVPRQTTGWGASFGSVALILQVAGLIASGIAWANDTTEFRLSPIEEGPEVTVSLSPEAPGTDAGGSVVVRF